jgi:hypothetical protein
LIERARRAHILFESQPPGGKRKLLDFVLSNRTWKGGRLSAKYWQPFDVLAVAIAFEQQRMGEGSAETANNEIRLPVRYTKETRGIRGGRDTSKDVLGESAGL